MSELPPCPICGKPDLYIGRDSQPGCPHCEVGVVLPEAVPPSAPDGLDVDAVAHALHSMFYANREFGQEDDANARMFVNRYLARLRGADTGGPGE